MKILLPLEDEEIADISAGKAGKEKDKGEQIGLAVAAAILHVLRLDHVIKLSPFEKRHG